MKTYEATEQAYKNGYEKGKQDAVKHGRWVLRQDDGYECYECSSCRANPLNDNAERPSLSDYCPNCGARMDGDGQ